MKLYFFIKHLFFNVWFPNWSPDAALRYLPIVGEIKKHRGLTTIADIGSGGLGIAPYLKRPVTGIDVSFKGPKHPLLKRVKGSVTKRADAFDAVVCVDVLEHVPASLRGRAISELKRVTKKMLFIVVPIGAAATHEDIVIARHIDFVLGQVDPYLVEHKRFGLPEASDISKYFGSGWQVTVRGNVWLPLHRLLLKTQFTKSKFMQFVSSVLFILCLPVFTRLNWRPTYRELFIARKL